MEYRDIGENIRKYRNRLDLTQDQLADRVGVTWEMISRYERGESSPMNKLDKLSKALGISVTDLIDDSCRTIYDIPLFVKIPDNLDFSQESTTVFYNCPRWLFKIDSEVFAIDIDLISDSEKISIDSGYLFISPNSEIKYSDLVLIMDTSEVRVLKHRDNSENIIGKVMMQEVI